MIDTIPNNNWGLHLQMFFRDPSCNSCLNFGVSGSGVVRKIGVTDNGTDRYSWVGPLSMYKGCDRVWTIDNKFNLAGENPGVFTSGICYLGWIAEQYNMKTTSDYIVPASCNISRGSLEDADKNGTECRTTAGTTCNFTGGYTFGGVTYDRCKIYAQEGYSYPVTRCYDTEAIMIFICQMNLAFQNIFVG